MNNPGYFFVMPKERHVSATLALRSLGSGGANAFIKAQLRIRKQENVLGDLLYFKIVQQPFIHIFFIVSDALPEAFFQRINI